MFAAGDEVVTPANRNVALSDHIPAGWRWLPTDVHGNPKARPRPLVIVPKLAVWLASYQKPGSMKEAAE